MFSTRLLRFSNNLVRRHATIPTFANVAKDGTVAGRLKTSTNITGIEVHPSPLSELDKVYTQTVSILETFPETSVYRQAAIALTQHRHQIVQKALTQQQQATVKDDVSKVEQIIQSVEESIDQGQLEVILLQANTELDLSKKMLEWKPWEPLKHPPAPGQWTYFSMAEEAGEGGEEPTKP